MLFMSLLFLQCNNMDREPWESKFDAALTEAGHRNWIVVADAAYPKQSAKGIETIATGKDHLDVLNIVLNRIENAPHVRLIIFMAWQETD